MLIEFVERGIMYRELEKGERRRKGERWGGERGREIQREPIEARHNEIAISIEKRNKEKEKKRERRRR